jgi:hypothetical protein
MKLRKAYKLALKNRKDPESRRIIVLYKNQRNKKMQQARIKRKIMNAKNRERIKKDLNMITKEGDVFSKRFLMVDGNFEGGKRR